MDSSASSSAQIGIAMLRVSLGLMTIQACVPQRPRVQDALCAEGLVK